MDAPKTRRENEVWQACDDLWALNTSLEALKGDQIREQLLKLGYKKGSPNEIYKYRASWRESRGISEKTLAQTVEVADPISRAVSLVYEQIQQEAQQKITSIQTESLDQLEALGKQNQILSTQYETLQEKHDALITEKEGLEISVELLRENLGQEQQKNRELKIRQEGLELLLSELKGTYVAQIHKLEKQLKDQGYLLSEKINEAKLETRKERDLSVKFERVFKIEFQKLRTLIKTIKLKTKTKEKSRMNKKKKTALLAKKALPQDRPSSLLK